MNKDFIDALNEIEKEKGISKDVIFEALESALISSYRKNFGTAQNVEVEIDKNTGKTNVFALKEIVEIVDEDLLEISLEDAKKEDPSLELGDIYREEITPSDFGRIAAQTAKQVVIQRIKDAERDVIYDQFIDREKEIITGSVQRISRGNVYIDLGKTEGVLSANEQIPGEEYEQFDRLKLLIKEVSQTPKGPQVLLSRSSPDLVTRLFELEVPEITDGIVEIYSISREAGSRTKIAVFSKDEDVDPLGACVGYKGSRVKSIVDELNGENIDIVIWSKDISEFIANSLSPSKVIKVEVNEEEESALVVVPDYQLSLAIGKGGQNARLAAKLTNWKIDIKSESQYQKILEERGEEDINTDAFKANDHSVDNEEAISEEVVDEEIVEHDNIDLDIENMEIEDSEYFINDDILTDYLEGKIDFEDESDESDEDKLIEF